MWLQFSVGDTPAVERGFLRTLALIKANAGALKDTRAEDLYAEALAEKDDETATTTDERASDRKKKKVTLADHLVSRYEKYGEQAFDEENEEAPMTTAQAERAALNEFKRAGIDCGCE